MSNAFTYSDKENERFPQHCMASTIVWAEIAKTIMSPEIGGGTTNEDGSVHIKYQMFEITLMPDGSFSGKRRLDTVPSLQVNETKISSPPSA